MSSLPIISGDENSLNSSRCTNKAAGIIVTVASLALIGVATTCGYRQYNDNAPSTRSTTRPFPSSGKLIVPMDDHRGRQLQQHVEKRSLQRFGDDEEELVATSSTVLEEPVIHKVDNIDTTTPMISGHARRSSLPMGELQHGEEGAADMVDIIPMATNEYHEVVEVDSVLMDGSDNVVTVDEAVARRRDAVVAKQGEFASNENVVIAFMNLLVANITEDVMKDSQKPPIFHRRFTQVSHGETESSQRTRRDFCEDSQGTHKDSRKM